MGSHAAPSGPPSPTPHPAGSYADVGGVSVGELVGNVTRDLSTLMRQELALAQAEVKAEVSKTGKAAGAVLYSSGRKKLREVNPTPERTVDTLKNVPDALKGEAGGHR